MRVRGSDLWPAPLTRDLVDETHHGHRLRGYPRDARTLGDVLGRAAARVPDRDAVVTRERRLTWRELRAEVDRMAGALHARHGVKPGDRVALLLLNSVDFCVGVFACARLGAVAVTLNTKLRAPELEFMLQNSGARILIMHEALWDEIAPIRATVPCEAVYVAGRPPAGTEPLDRLTDTRERPPAVVVDEDDTAFIMYTSGTTGRPKRAFGTHAGRRHRRTARVAAAGHPAERVRDDGDVVANDAHAVRPGARADLVGRLAGADRRAAHGGRRHRPRVRGRRGGRAVHPGPARGTRLLGESGGDGGDDGRRLDALGRPREDRRRRLRDDHGSPQGHDQSRRREDLLRGGRGRAVRPSGRPRGRRRRRGRSRVR